jgi:hypothetical protein
MTMPLFSLDGAGAAGAVTARAGENDGNGLLALVFGQGFQEDVDGQVQPVRVPLRPQEELVVVDGHGHLRRDQVDVAAFHRLAVLGVADLHLGLLRQQFHHQALEVRRQVLDDEEGEIILGRQSGEETLEGLQSPGRSSDANEVVGACSLSSGSGVRSPRTH